MQITFTQHALARMVERGISRAEVMGALAQPLRTVGAQDNRKEVQAWVERSGQHQLLRVLYEDDIVITVVIAMVTSKFEKYGVQA